jgi:hypothetical protein
MGGGARVISFGGSAARRLAYVGWLAAFVLGAGCGDGAGAGPLPLPPDLAPDAAADRDAAEQPDQADDLPRPAALELQPAMMNFGDVLDCGGDGPGSKPVKFTLSNPGDTDIGRPTVTASEAFVIVGDGCAALDVLPAGGSCTVAVSFVPVRLGSQSGTLTATAAGLQVAATLSGRAVSHGEVVLGAPLLELPPTLVGQVSATRAIKLTNGRSTAIDVTAAATDSAEFIVGGDCQGRVPACKSCEATVAFRPGGRGVRTANLVLAYAGGSVVAALSGTGRLPARLGATPPSLEFGKVPLGTRSGLLTVMVGNSGDEEAPLTTIVSGEGADEFSVSSACGATLPPGESCGVVVVLAPNRVGPAVAELAVVGSPGGTATVALTGSGVPRDRLDIKPLSTDFGPLVRGSTSPPITLTVSNIGAMNSGALLIEPQGADPRDFMVVNDACSGFDLAPLASCAVQVRFAPAAPGAKTAVLAAMSAGGSTVSAALMGLALAPAAIALAPEAADFGVVLIGRPGVVPLAVGNTGGEDTGELTLSAPPAPFVTTFDDCTGRRLAPGKSCTVVLGFAPDEVGESRGALLVSAMPGGTASLPLRGRALAAAEAGLAFEDGADTGVAGHDFSAASPGVGFEATRRFHGTVVGVATEPITVFVHNRASRPSGPLAVSLDDARDFAIVEDGCTALEPGAQCPLKIAFNPGVAGDRHATLTVSSPDAGAAALALDGVGLPLLEIVRVVGDDEELVTTWDFGTWPAGQLDGPHETFRVRARSNAGAVTVALTGPGFVATIDRCQGTTLAGAPTYFGDACTIEIGFVPPLAGAAMGALEVGTAAGADARLLLLGSAP